MARWVIDASGLNGTQLLRQPKIATQHICAAAQAVFAVNDAAAYAVVGHRARREFWRGVRGRRWARRVRRNRPVRATRG